MTTSYDWSGRIGDVWAAEWLRTDRSFTELSRQLDAAILAAAPAGPFRALDIGCGAGGTSLALATARPDAELVGIDLSAGLVATARGRAADRPNCRFDQGDAVAAAAQVHPDLFISRHGVMFFPDPAAAFAGFRASAKPGAALVFSCFGPRAANRFATLADELLGTAPPPADDIAPGPFAFADHDRVWSILDRAGWQPEAAAKVEFAYRLGDGAEPIEDAVGFMSRIGPAAAPLAEAPDRARLRALLAEKLEPYRTGDVVEVPASAWIWRARAA